MALKDIKQPLVNVDVNFDEPLERFYEMMNIWYGKKDFWHGFETEMALLLFLKHNPPENYPESKVRTIKFSKLYQKLKSKIFCTVRPKAYNYVPDFFYKVTVKIEKKKETSTLKSFL